MFFYTMSIRHIIFKPRFQIIQIPTRVLLSIVMKIHDWRICLLTHFYRICLNLCCCNCSQIHFHSITPQPFLFLSLIMFVRSSPLISLHLHHVNFCLNNSHKDCLNCSGLRSQICQSQITSLPTLGKKKQIGRINLLGQTVGVLSGNAKILLIE